MSRLNRAQRAFAAQKTLSILADGRYTTAGGNAVDIGDRVSASRADSTAYHTQTQLDALLASSATKTRTESTSMEVTRETTLAACMRLSAEPGTRVAALNFASAKNVCGGMRGGSLAQEESLGLCSSLHDSLSAFSEEYYFPNRKDPLDGLYHHSLIHTPNCVVFREDADLRLAEEDEVFITDVITCPAVNKGVYMKKGGTQSSVDSTMLRRTELVLAAAAHANVTHLVLGAWGCGVFGNDPSDVAGYFAECLVGDGARFANVFSTVVFAIAGKKGNAADDRNFEVFRKRFGEA